MLNNDDYEKLFLDISDTSAVGENVKYDDDFIFLEEEIQKLSSISNINGIDYEKIEELSKKILIEKSKDINTICYLSFSLIHKGNEGLKQAINILGKFINKYWETAYPSIKRLKARVNIINWWFSKLEKFINSIEFLDFSLEEKKELIDEILNLDEILNSKMKDSLSINLLSLKEHIEMKSIKINKTKSKTENQEKKQKAQDNSNIKVIEKVSKESLKSANIKEIQNLYVESLKNSKELLNHLFEANIYKSELFIINRLEMWSDLESAPINDDGLTMLTQPQDHQINYLENLFNEKNWEELLKEAESLSDEYIFWLDLQFYVVKALEGLGKNEEKKSVEFLLMNFLEKVGKIQNFKFKDKKTTFASKRTSSWIRQLNKKQDESSSSNNSSNLNMEVSNFNWCINDYVSSNNKKIGEYL